MRHIITLLIALVLVSFVNVKAEENDGRMGEIPMFSLEKKDVPAMKKAEKEIKIPASVSVKMREKKAEEVPFEKMAWENSKSFSEENRIMNLGIGF